MAKNYALLPEAATMYTQTKDSEVKDMSKNLVTGDIEREYRGVEKNGKKRNISITTLAVAVGCLAVWLLLLSVVREVQISRLRHEVDQLTANVLAMTANVKSLNQKISNKWNDEFKTFEDAIYADEEQNILVEDVKDTSSKDKNNPSLDKLQGLAVLEDDDDLADDEDMYDGDDEDAESGDWYPDYDKRREKIGTTNMVRLKLEDLGSTVMEFNKKQLDESILKDFKWKLNENPENPDIALPSLPSTTESSDSQRAKRSVYPDSTVDFIDEFAAPKVVAKSEERRKTKKYVPNAESTTSPKTTMKTISRTTRNSDDEGGSRRPFIAAHFHGNTSHLNTEIHEYYKGNGLVRVAHDAAHNVWYPSPWTLASPHPRPTLNKNGHIHVHHTGVYLVYVQIYYLDTHDVISWVLHRTNPDFDGRETLLQCAQSSHSLESMEKPNSCFSAAALFLKKGDRLAVRNTGGDRHSLMQSEKSFIGLVKLADAEDPDQGI